MSIGAGTYIHDMIELCGGRNLFGGPAPEGLRGRADRRYPTLDLEAVIAQDPEHFGDVATTGEFARRHLFQPLGMRESAWEGESFATSWKSSLRDMARLGLLLVHGGVWDQRRLLDRAWVQKMTHAGYEDGRGIPTRVGYGWFVKTQGERRVVEHSGSLDGFFGTMVRHVDEGVTFVVLTNYEKADLEAFVEVLETDFLRDE